MSQRGIAIVSEQRRREYMEDTHYYQQDFFKPGWMFGGVYDGHFDDDAAVQAADELHLILEGELKKNPKATCACFRKTYEEMQRMIHTLDPCTGTCAATFLLQEERVTVANVGDCRILVVGDRVRQLTIDHTVFNQTERRRVLKAGSTISKGIYMQYKGDGVQLTRTLGGRHFKPGGQLAKPYVRNYWFTKKDRFLIAASDGLFHKTNNDTIGEIASVARDEKDAAEMLKHRVDIVNGGDNLTIMVVRL